MEERAPKAEWTRKRIIAFVLLVAYVLFAVWAFVFSHAKVQSSTIFFLISVLLWFVLRAIQRRP